MRRRSRRRFKWSRIRPFIGGLSLGVVIIVLGAWILTPGPPPEPHVLEIPALSLEGIILLAGALCISGILLLRWR
jgi:hypothetical protein